MACRLQCLECGIAFYGRADAHYCCGACRQKNYRARLAHHAAAEAARVQARETRQQARALREQAHGMRERAHGMLERAGVMRRAEANTRVPQSGSPLHK